MTIRDGKVKKTTVVASGISHPENGSYYLAKVNRPSFINTTNFQSGISLDRL